MANNYTSLKLAYDTAYRFREDFSSVDHKSIKYVFIGNSNSYANSDFDIPEIQDSVADEKTVWDTMFAAKRVTGNDVELVVPRYNWAANTRYRQYDDKTELVNLITTDTNIGAKPMYVINSSGNVYKCLCNNVSANSTVEPTGDYNTNQGFIVTADDYLWKYLYNVKQSNKFFTKEWIPSPSSINALEYNLSSTNLVEGSLAKIAVVSRGSGYFDANVTVSSFTSGTSTLTSVSNMSNVNVNMSVVGTGISPGTYITAVNQFANTITLSVVTTSTGGGLANNIAIVTRAEVDGDGNGDTITSVRIISGQIDKITVTTIGTGYSYANVYIHGLGTGATARAVLPPKYGHGFNPAREIGSQSVIVVKKIGDVDSTEGELISIDTSFRQYGLLSSPHKYGQSNTSIDLEDANTVISQTTDLTMVSGSPYTLNEQVYQGTSVLNSTFSGVVHAQTPNNVVRLINTRGTLIVGGSLYGNTSGVGRAVISKKDPDLDPYSGDILYVQNAPAVTRYDGQAEDIKFVIKF
jgi:hypothetical protein